MTLLSIIALATAMFLLAITPGPGVFATVSKALSSGFRQSIPVVAGIVIGDLLFLLFAIYGLAVIAETFSQFFTLVKYLGALYLIWLGITLWRRQPSEFAITTTLTHTARSGFLAGLSITLGNPKVILFYLGFLPTFIDLDRLDTLDVLIVASVVSLILGSVMLGYAFTAAKARQFFRSRQAQERMQKTAGSVMIGTGILLLSKN